MTWIQRTRRLLAGLMMSGLLASAAGAEPGRAPDLTLTGAMTSAAHETYVELPFEVPAGTARLTVEFAYTGKEQKSVIDLGLRDPERFRGWSGGGKDRFTVSDVDATPSYLAGPLTPGTWRLILGAPNIRKQARAEYVARIWLDRAAAPLADFSPTPAPDGARWWRGDLHMHTAHSDGVCRSRKGARAPCPVFKTLEAAAARGLDFVAVTDHNTTAHFEALRELAPYFDDLLIVPGREVTTFRGHANLFGPTSEIDFQLGSPRAPRMSDIQAQSAKAGGLFSINHPGLPSGEFCMGCGWTATDTDYDAVQAVEVVNGGIAEGPLSGLAFWEARLNEGRRITAIGGSDNHDPGLDPAKAPAIGVPTTVVRASQLSLAAILDAIRRGHVFIDVAGTADRLLEVSARSRGARAQMGDDLAAPVGRPIAVEVRVVGAAGGRVRLAGPAAALVAASDLAVDADDQTLLLALTADGRARWLRVDVLDADGKLILLGNPLYLHP